MFADYIKGSKQKLFDTVALHLLKQGEQSTHPINPRMCMYRGLRGTKCAIGALIDDSEYSSDMEGKDINLLFHCGLLPGIVWSDKRRARLDIMLGLQMIHDDCLPAMWVRELKKFAKKNKLRVTAIDKFLKEKEQSK